MTFDHERYVVVGTDSKTADAIKALFNNSFKGGLEVDELDKVEVAFLEKKTKDDLLERYCELY